MTGSIDHPEHYTSRDIGYECIDLTQYQTFCVGNTIKYLWRAPFKGHKTEDLRKALWYATRASQRQEEVNIAPGQCNDIILSLITTTRGYESAAWTGLLQRKWYMTLAALDMMIEENKE